MIRFNDLEKVKNEEKVLEDVEKQGETLQDIYDNMKTITSTNQSAYNQCANEVGIHLLFVLLAA